MDDNWNKIMNREKFSYDLNGDALYQQYKDQYMRQGQMAMEDTMGQAAALTGGYGNSYAQQVGQQAYNGYLRQLNDRVPELYQLALDQYNREGQELYNQYALHSDRYAQKYGEHRDKVSDYNTKLNYLTEDARYRDTTGYNRHMDNNEILNRDYRDGVGDWQAALDRAGNDYWNEKNFGYGQHSDSLKFAYQQRRDDVSDDQWQASFDEGVRQFNNNSLVSAIASTGYTPTDEELSDAGMSRKQADAMKPVQETKSIDAGSDAEAAIMSAIDGAKSVDDLAGIVAKYVNMGYSEAELVAMTEGKAKEFEQKQTNFPIIHPNNLDHYRDFFKIHP